jgi:hypothetical protein
VKTDAARELLKRWADDDLLNPFGPLRGLEGTMPKPLSTTVAASENDQAVTGQSTAGSPRRQSSAAVDEESSDTWSVFRLDVAHPTTNEAPSSAVDTDRASFAPDTELPRDEQTPGPVKTPRLHRPHLATTPAPHFDVQTAIADDHARSTNWSLFWGQILAYFGVAGLTVGTSLVLWGYFGGPASYTPTGWLTATAGQMLLFLGVVTLISGGMEQTTDEVARRIDRLGAYLVRIEQGSGKHGLLRGPHASANRSTEDDLPLDNADQRHTQQATRHNIR